MSCLSLRSPAAVLTLGLAALLSMPAMAEECTYNDLLGTFSVTADCEGLKDHSNLGNEQKRIWLSGDWGQVNIIEVPSPYKQDASQIDLIMSNLGRVYSSRRSPGGVQETTVAGQDARVVIEHKMRTSSRSWVFNWQGRNLIMRAVAYGKKKQRMEHLDSMSAALTSTFAETSGPVAKPEMPKTKGKVRDRAIEPTSDMADDVKKTSKDRAEDAKEAATDMADDGASSSKARADDAKDEATDMADEAMDAGEAKVKGGKDAVEETADDATDAVEETEDDATDAVESKAEDAAEGSEPAE